MRTESQDHVVACIALKTGVSIEVAKESYLAALLELSAEARVHIYLPLLAAKRAVARLQKASTDRANRTRSPDLNTKRGNPMMALTAGPCDRVGSPFHKQPPVVNAPPAVVEVEIRQGIDRGTSGVAVIRRQVLAQIAKIKESINAS